MRKSIIFLTLLLIVACKREAIEPVDMGYNYFPVSIGMEWKYDVDSTFYNDFNQGAATTKSVRVIETVVDTFLDLAGNLNYRIDRKTMNDGSIVSTTSYSVYKSSNSIISNYNNQKVVSLTFPVVSGGEWDGYAYSNNEGDPFEILEVSGQTNFNGITFDSIVRVLHYEDTTNFIFKDYKEERYARNIGRYYREFLVKETQRGIDSGLYVIEKLVE